MDFDWGDESEDTSNVFSGVDDYKSRSTRGGGHSKGSSKSERMNGQIKVVHTQNSRGRSGRGGISDVVMYPPPRYGANPRMTNTSSDHVRGGSPTYRKKDNAETYYPQTPAPSPDNQTKTAENESSSWFPMEMNLNLPSIASFGWASSPSDEHIQHRQKVTGTNERNAPITKLRNSPIKSGPGTRTQNTTQKNSTDPFGPTTKTQKAKQKNSTNKSGSRSSSGSQPSNPSRPKYINPFESLPTSVSKSDSSEIPNGYEKFRSRSYSRSPSPVYQRPSRQNINTANSEFHSLLSCASSPSDEQFMRALEILATSKNPRQLAKMKLSDAHNWTALHIAGLSNPPLYLMYALLLVFPEGAKECDEAGRLPLHLVAGSETNVCLLNTLVRFHKESICTKDDRGLVPLHLALLRDGNEEIPVDVFRILLGQNISAGEAGIRIGKGSPRKVRDGYMRNGKHLNLQLGEIQGGVLGISRNAIMAKERKQREMTMRLMNQGAKESLSRGFARNIEDVDSQDGNPHKHEHLASLWMNEGQHISDPFEAMEIREADKFSPEVQHCLKQLANWKKKYDREQKRDVLEETEPSPVPIINPATIPAPPYMRLPVHMAVRRNHKKKQSMNDGRNDYPLALPPNQNEILRILIHAFPLSLMIRDSQDQTPLMTCLCLVHHPAIHPVDLDMIELLLGMRTAGYRATPKWLEDADFFLQHQKSIPNNSSSSYGTLGLTSNAAMIPAGETLPLHIAAQEALSLSIINAIHTCYPGAKYAQDERNCTPLHLALQNLTGVDTLDIEMVRVLMDSRVLRIKNSLQQSIFDLLVANAKAGKLPRILKGTKDFKMNTAKSFQPIFEHAAIEEVLNSPSAVVDKDEFFSKLYSLPSWLRKEACATPAVQSILIKEVASRSNTAWILLYGVMLLAHVIIFNSMVDSIISGQKGNINIVTSDPQKVGALVTNLYLSCYGLSYTFTAMRLKIGLFDLVTNVWAWVNCVALVSSYVVTVRIIVQERASGTVDLNDDLLYTMSTIAVGMLWAAFVGYLARWWYGIGCFCSSIIKMAKGLISPIIVLAMFTMSFMQMVYIIHTRDAAENQCLYKEGNVNGESIEICSLWDSFKIVYLLVIGEGFLGAEASSSDATIVVLLVFIVLVFILILHIISLSILKLQTKGVSTAMVDSFWSPILIHVLLMQRLKKVCCCTRSREKSMPSRVEAMWEYIIFSYSDVDIKDTKWWYLQKDLGGSHLLGKKWFVRIVGIFFIPVWICVGAATLGILWPPQVRQWLFQIGMDNDHIYTQMDSDGNSQRTILQSDVTNMKMMLYDRFQVVENELRELRFAVEENKKMVNT